MTDLLTELSDEERRDYLRDLEEATDQDMAAAGLVIPGHNPYNWSWDFNLDNFPAECPDDIHAEVTKATLVVATPTTSGKGVRESTLRRVTMNGSDVQKLRESSGFSRMREWSGFPDPFAYGVSGIGGGGGITGQYLPLWPGPVTRQLYWQDYWMMSAKAFEAYNHDPISWRCVHLKAEFALGRGLDMKVTRSRNNGGQNQGQRHDRAQVVWDEFWSRNKMDARLDLIARDYCWAGEQFLRYFKKGTKLTVRSLDPASIYDLITDPEDIETVFAYHQQFQTAYQLYPPKTANPSAPNTAAPTGPSTPGAAVKYIIRQILPQEVDHYKSNASAYERRGRSDLFPALGWIKRLRDYLTAHVVQADMQSRIAWDLKVAGNQAAITSLREKLFPGGRAPAPGTVFAHNIASELASVHPERTAAASRGDAILDALVTMVALSGGVPKDWLGFGMQNTRAGALVATEPAAKSLQELQGTLEGIIHDAFERVMKAASVSDAQLEVTFPSIANEDRKSKLDDLGTMEGMGWLSKKSASSLAAKEMDISNYEYEVEQDLIAEEFQAPEKEEDDEADPNPITGKQPKRLKRGDKKVRRQVIMATKRQAPKLDLTVSPDYEDDPAGLLVPRSGNELPAPGSPDGTGTTVPGGGSHKTEATRGGNLGNENPMGAEGAKNIRKDNTKMSESAADGFDEDDDEYDDG